MLAASAHAATGTLHSGAGKVIVWRSVDAWSACKDAQKVGQPEPICLQSAVALVPNGTKARRLGSGEGFFLGAYFTKVQILTGKYAGAEGVVPFDQFDLDTLPPR